MLARAVTARPDGAGSVLVDCSAAAMRAAFALAFETAGALVEGVDVEAAGAERCLVRATRQAWTVYYCALSRLGPPDLHPLTPQPTELAQPLR